LIIVTLVFALDVRVCVFSARLFSFPVSGAFGLSTRKWGDRSSPCVH
jgi:hypothetical protein